ncbi:hypothetical protein NCC78_25075 [Micromonospora phytophila]|uniref:hypothetical protein n=1 Tax=Micromonospora phytophila TaxID=709888 RepID=UPI0020304313|nr:hypothetical protein [Micromonospora phytophila]MCM0677923.1 hypothetical protein [Micromonospora phytophila]
MRPRPIAAPGTPLTTEQPTVEPSTPDRPATAPDDEPVRVPEWMGQFADADSYASTID